MRVEKCLLGYLLDGITRVVLYRQGYSDWYRANLSERRVIDFSDKTLLEVLYYLNIMFGVKKEKVSII